MGRGEGGLYLTVKSKHIAGVQLSIMFAFCVLFCFVLKSLVLFLSV